MKPLNEQLRSKVNINLNTGQKSFIANPPFLSFSSHNTFYDFMLDFEKPTSNVNKMELVKGRTYAAERNPVKYVPTYVFSFLFLCNSNPALP